MFLIILSLFIVVDSNVVESQYLGAAEPHVFTSFDSSCTSPNWADWTANAERMTWWQKHGWQILDGVKSEVALGFLENAQNFDPLNFDPLAWNLLPDSVKPLHYTLPGNKTLQLLSLKRCEVLYQRHLINEQGLRKSSKQ